MYLMVLACDLDGTLAEDGVVANATWAHLRRARAAGLALILVTGRTLHSFTPEGPYAELFDAIVAEDGAVVYFPQRDRVILPFGHLGAELNQRLDQLDIPLERGMAIAATHVPHDEAILEMLRELGGGASIEYNRGAVMVLPPGATKGTGLLRALHELGYSAHNVVACGDAENDRSLFEVAEVAAAVANATAPIQALADVVLPEADGAGVRRLLDELLAGRVPAHRQREGRRLFLGHQLDGAPCYLDAPMLLRGNLGIIGASGGGKSWLAGLLAEELLKQGYQICIIDPEGDYRSLHAFPHTLLLGGAGVTLPPVGDVLTLSEYADLSLVLDLSQQPAQEQCAYVAALLRGLLGLRAQRGRPHWLLVDEAQRFCPPAECELTDTLRTLMGEGGVSIVSYRPSQVAPAVLAGLQHWLITRLALADELDALAPSLERCPGWASVRSQLPLLPLGQAYLCAARGSDTCEASAHQIVVFRSGPRTVPHIRHLHKYLRAPLPAPRRFYFHDGAGRSLGRAAASLWEFREAMRVVPIDSLSYHLRRGDFERWLRDVLHDEELARKLNKTARRELRGEALRQALDAVVTDRYAELERLI